MIWEKVLADDKEIVAIRRLEEQIQKEIPVVTSQIKWNDFGIYLRSKSIIGLGLFSQQLNLIPSELWNLGNLEVLNIVNCGLKELTEMIGSLTLLKELYIGGNQLKIIPKSIQALNNLSVLYILEDGLLSIPEEIGNLRNLKELSITTKFIKNLPQSIIKLTTSGCRVYMNNREITTSDSEEKRKLP